MGELIIGLIMGAMAIGGIFMVANDKGNGYMTQRDGKGITVITVDERTLYERGKR